MARSGHRIISSKNRSPFGRIFLRPDTDQVINITMDLKQSFVDIDALKKELSRTIVASHPRFSSLLVRDRWGSGDMWRKTVVNVDDHVIVVAAAAAAAAYYSGTNFLEREATVNGYLGALAGSRPLSMEKPLWEVHVLEGLGCVVMRIHHAIGDGLSLMSMLSACFFQQQQQEEEGGGGGGGGGGGEKTSTMVKAAGGGTAAETIRTTGRKGGVLRVIKTMWLTAAYEMGLAGRILGVIKDNKTALTSGCDCVELPPRTLVTINLNLEDFKQVKKAIPGATLNDVLLGVISSGLWKYLDAHSPKALLKGLHITGLVVANLRKVPGLQDMSTLMGCKSGSGWGNKFGLFLLPINCEQEAVHPLQHVRKMKDIMDRKKQSIEAQLSHRLLGLAISVLGLEMGSWLYKRILGATTLLISNITGPPKEIAIAGNPVTNMRINISSLPQGITVHMLSYAGRANLQMSLANDVIPDAEFLVKCFEESLTEMKNSQHLQ